LADGIALIAESKNDLDKLSNAIDKTIKIFWKFNKCATQKYSYGK